MTKRYPHLIVHETQGEWPETDAMGNPVTLKYDDVLEAARYLHDLVSDSCRVFVKRKANGQWRFQIEKHDGDYATNVAETGSTQ